MLNEVQKIPVESSSHIEAIGYSGETKTLHVWFIKGGEYTYANVPGEHYHITYTVICFPQNVLAFSLYEKPMDSSCYPYEYFISTRFAVKAEDIEALMQLVKDCNDSAMIDIDELMKNSNLILQP